MRKIIPDNEIVNVLLMYSNGLSALDIAVKYGCKSSHPVLNVLKSNNALRSILERNRLVAIKNTGKSKMSIRKAKMSDEKIIELYKNGLSSYEVGKLAGISYSGIDRVLKKNGVSKRTAREATLLKIENGTHFTPWKPMEQHCFWNGGRIYKDGYVYVKKPEHPRSNKKGYVAEHILVSEQKIGRYLELGEVVHHINGTRDDNRPENVINLPERIHAAISSAQGRNVPRLKDVLQQRIRELEQEIIKLKINPIKEDEYSNDAHFPS